MAAKKWLRKRFFVDFRVQGALIVRVVLYWLMCLATMALFLLGWRMLRGPVRSVHLHLNELWAQYGPLAAASLLLLPIVILDLLQISNRFAGPMVRLRRSMHDLALGKPVKAIHFRQGDFWSEIAEDFNKIAAKDRGSEACDMDPVCAGVDDPLSIFGESSRRG
jgi:hypothetical protein